MQEKYHAEICSGLENLDNCQRFIHHVNYKLYKQLNILAGVDRNYLAKLPAGTTAAIRQCELRTPSSPTSPHSVLKYCRLTYVCKKIGYGQQDEDAALRRCSAHLAVELVRIANHLTEKQQRAYHPN